MNLIISVYQFRDFSVPLQGFRSEPDISSIPSSNYFFVFSSIPSSSSENQFQSKIQSTKELKKYLKLELEPDISSITRLKTC